MPRKLFCEISPLTYRISVLKNRFLRRMRNWLSGTRFARVRGEKLPCLVYAHQSLIRRQLGDVDMRLQENKAANLALAAPRVDGILIRPGETFSFWALVGACTARRGYREGLLIAGGKAAAGVGGGMCQFTNLLHWLVLHSELTVTERHHHDRIDLFPDFGRQVPFGVGTSIMYNYLDYRFKNSTNDTYQLIVCTTDRHLRGELRASSPSAFKFHIVEENARFERRQGALYRRNTIVRRVVDKKTGDVIRSETLQESNARVAYDEKHIAPEMIVEVQTS